MATVMTASLSQNHVEKTATSPTNFGNRGSRIIEIILYPFTLLAMLFAAAISFLAPTEQPQPLNEKVVSAKPEGVEMVVLESMDQVKELNIVPEPLDIFSFPEPESKVAPCLSKQELSCLLPTPKDLEVIQNIIKLLKNSGTRSQFRKQFFQLSDPIRDAYGEYEMKIIDTTKKLITNAQIADFFEKLPR